MSWCHRYSFGLLSVLCSASVARAGSPGVTDTEIVLGQVAAFSGASAGLGVEYWRGTQAMLQQANDAGGVFGRKMRLELCDDEYEPTSAAACTNELVRKRHVFILVNSVGTPTIRRIAELLESWASENALLFGNFTGAQFQREMPFAPRVFNVRASYHQEAVTHVRACLAAGKKAIGTFVQDDVFGLDGEEGVRIALRAKGLFIAGRTNYPRGASFDIDFAKQVATLRTAGVNCVSTTGSYQAIAAFVRAVRAVGWNVPIYGMSFTGADPLLSLLSKVPGGTSGVYISQVVPSPDDTSLPLVNEYRAAMDKYSPVLPPPPFAAGGYVPPTNYSYGSLEAYLNTKVLVEVLLKSTPNLTCSGFQQAAEHIKGLDVGLGRQDTISFSPVTSAETRYNHQALNSVWLTTVQSNRWVVVR